MELWLHSWHSVFVPEKGWNSADIHGSVFVPEKGGTVALFMAMCVCGGNNVVEVLAHKEAWVTLC